MRDKFVCGVGINDADYVVKPTVDGKRACCEFYCSWREMIRRCYSTKWQEKNPTYIGCTVCEEWLTFSNFKSWMEKQDWKGKQLDKDVIYSNNKKYSPDTCVFISPSLNKLLTDRAASRGAFPLGVNWNKGNKKFVSQIRVNGKNSYLGYFVTYQAAHAAWQQAKQETISYTAMHQTDERIKDALLLRCTQLKHDIDNNLETKKL